MNVGSGTKQKLQQKLQYKNELPNIIFTYPRKNVTRYFFFAVQPKILPIPALTNLLREGMRAAISCQILEGDLPVAFRWEKNGQPVTSSPYAPSGIITRRMDEYSASLVIEQVTSLHSGNYTCIASNVAGSERYTIPLTVNGNDTFLNT